MRLTDSQVAEFQEVFKNYFGFEIGKEQAIRQAVDLLTMVQFVYKPLKKKEITDYQLNNSNNDS